jgi:hypothetical protein
MKISSILKPVNYRVLMSKRRNPFRARSVKALKPGFVTPGQTTIKG